MDVATVDWRIVALVLVSFLMFLIGMWFYLREIYISAHIEAEKRMREQKEHDELRKRLRPNGNK